MLGNRLPDQSFPFLLQTSLRQLQAQGAALGYIFQHSLNRFKRTHDSCIVSKYTVVFIYESFSVGSFCRFLTYTLYDRMVYRMKVTALLPDQLISEIKTYAKGKTLTESLTIALEEWLQLKKIVMLNKQVQNKPLEFQKDFNATTVRNLSRRT